VPSEWPDLAGSVGRTLRPSGPICHNFPCCERE
jgi:hypothetical protein